jgi:hypothetical protein
MTALKFSLILENRETRVGSWRDFSKTSKKKKAKKGPALLG